MEHEDAGPRPDPEKEGQPVKPEPEEEGGPVKSFLEHLEDLRWTLIRSGAAILIAMVVCLIAAPQLVRFLTDPIARSGITVNLEAFSPLGGFTISLKLGFYGGMAFAMPFVLYYVGQFVFPALKTHEKKYFIRAFTVGTGFFLIGLVVCYYVILPLSLKGLTEYNRWLKIPVQTWRAEEYFEFVIKFALGVGLLFEIPVVILTLVRLGVIPYRLLLKGRSYMFLINFILCAILTPADLVTTFIMAIGLQVGYEVCLLIARVWERQRQSKALQQT
jgi:sec-independent protein translocase protein TatC